MVAKGAMCRSMEVFAIIFSFIISFVLALIIANAGAKRQIGFGWSFFLGIWLTPIVSLIAVFLSEKIKPNEYGAIKKKWGCLVPLLISATLILIPIFLFYSYKEKQKTAKEQYQKENSLGTSHIIQNTNQITNKERVVIISQEEVVPVVLFNEPTNETYESLTKKGTNPVNEITIDLNDFIGTPDDGTDWNSTELSEEHCKALARHKIYYSENKGVWVKEKLSITDNNVLEAQRHRELAEQELRKQSICKISFDLQGRQAKQIPTVPNRNSIVGIIIMKIEVSPKGEVVNCNIENRSSIDNSQIRQECVSATLKTKFNIVDNKRNQFGTIRYIF